VRQATGAFTWGFILLSLFSAICLIVVLKKSDSTVREPIRAVQEGRGEFRV
jgi:hypothetical protein